MLLKSTQRVFVPGEPAHSNRPYTRVCPGDAAPPPRRAPDCASVAIWAYVTVIDPFTGVPTGDIAKSIIGYRTVCA